MHIPKVSRSGQRLVLVAGVLAIYAALVLALHGLTFPVDRDELHFWPTSLQFSHNWLPSLALLRSYNELNTPLPFVVFGTLEHLFHGGIMVARAFNLALSLAIVLWVGLADQRGDWSGPRAASGLMLFPYYLGVATHLYTDIIAATLVLAGLELHRRRRYTAAALAFMAGIASRQYMVAFPAALVVWEAAQAWRERGSRARVWSDPAWIMPLLACVSLLGWIAFFGGLAPANAVHNQHLSTAHLFRIIPAHALYALTCLGAYYVVPEWVLFPRPVDLRPLASPVGMGVAACLLVLFALFPPLQNDVIVPTMGFLDRFVRLFAPDWMRMAIFYVLALLVVLRFARWHMAGCLVLANTVVLLKAHIGWDKYVLALLVVLWLLRAAHEWPGEAEASEQP